MVFSVAVGYIKHLAMTRVAWELLCFQPLQTRGSDARCRQPRPPCGCVGQVCRVCAECVPTVCRLCAECACVRRESQRDSGATIYRESLALLLSVRCDIHLGVSPVPAPAHHTCSPSSTAGAGISGSGLPGVDKLWPAAAEHCRSHLTRARGAAPLGGSSSSHSRRRLLSRWNLCGCAGGPRGRRGAWHSQASAGIG